MKLQSITVENFGIYAQRTFEFGGSSVVLVYGENESGKTTALNGIRQTLYGFPVRTPYLVGQTMRAQASLESKQGSQVEFTRRKARVDEIVGTVDGSPVSAETIKHLLCNLTLDDYQSLFGFSLLELQRGEDALKTTPLTHALAGGGLDGMTRLESLQGDLAQTLGDLYKSRGQNAPINTLLREIQQTREALRKKQVLPSVVMQLQTELKEKQAEALHLRDEQLERMRVQAELERFGKARPLCVQLRQYEGELATIEIPDSVDSRTVANWSEFTRRRGELAKESLQLQQDARRNQLLLQQMGGNELLVGHEASIAQLGRKAGAIAEKRSQLAKLRSQHNTATQKRLNLLGTLNLAEHAESLHPTSLAPHVHSDLLQLSDEFVALTQQELTTVTRLDALRESVVEESPDALQLGEEELHEIESALDALIEGEAELRRHEQLYRAQTDDPALAELHNRLTSQLLPGSTLDESFHIPSDASLQTFAAKQREIQQELTSDGKQLSKLQAEIVDLRRRSEASLEPEDSQLLKDVAHQKSLRDALLDQWLDELSQPLIAASIDAEQQRGRLEELQAISEQLDGLQNRMLRSAKSLAKKTYLDDTLAERTHEEQTTSLRIEELCAAGALIDKQLSDSFRHIPISMGAAEIIVRWASDFRTWQVQRQKAAASAKQLYIQQGVVSEYRCAVVDLWPVAIAHTVSSSTLASQLQRWQTLAQQTAENSARRKKTLHDCDQLAKQLDRTSQKKAEISAKYLSWLSSMPVPNDWPIESVGKLIDTLHDVQLESETIARCNLEVEEIQQALAEFEASVSTLRSAIDIDLPAGHAEQHAQALSTQLSALQKNQSERAKISAAVEHTSVRATQVENELRELDGRIADICATVGDQNPQAVQETMQRIAKCENIRSEVTQLKASLLVLAGSADLEEFVDQTMNSDATDTRLLAHELQREVDSLEQQREKCNQSIGVLSERFEKLSQNDEAAALRQQLTGLRSQLADLAQQWILFKTGHHILNRSIELFAEENEPELIRLARKFLSQLTGGRYTTVEHQRGKGGGFKVRSSDGTAYSPELLSSGTREQLYLALRMAYISHHCSSHEPLPVLMDDCFVNFDDKRMHHAIEAIGQWGNDIQTVIFSCHRRTHDAVELLLPEAKIIELRPHDALALTSI